MKEKIRKITCRIEVEVVCDMIMYKGKDKIEILFPKDISKYMKGVTHYEMKEIYNVDKKGNRIN